MEKESIGHFAASRKQLHRMSAIVCLLKKHDWVPMREILRCLGDTEFETGAYLGCGNRTIQRDIKVLQEEYHAPIEYSKREAAYTLYNKDWAFQVPALLNPDELLAVMIGGKLSRDIFPDCISSRVDRAVGEILRYNGSEYITPALVESLKLLPDAVAVVPDAIFQAAFESWRTRHVLRIRYAGKDGAAVLRDVEPHTLVFHEMRWSIKGFCRLRQAVRTFHLARIRSAQILDATFVPSQAIIDSVTSDQFLDYERVYDVTLRVNESGRQFAAVYALHSRQSFVRGDDGFYTMFVPSVPLERLVSWVLRQGGDAAPLEPSAAVEAVRSAIRRLADSCQAYAPNEIQEKIRRKARRERQNSD